MTNDDRASVAACAAGLADDSAFAPDFDALVDRSGTASAKWEKYAGRDVLPFWVADMDLPTPPFVVDALCHDASSNSVRLGGRCRRRR